eukprot:m.38083 g.38083  ORF g.38083 m.38083 type:complete len:489 (+) comp13287_c0_seq1:277-1743(+)
MPKRSHGKRQVRRQRKRWRTEFPDRHTPPLPPQLMTLFAFLTTTRWWDRKPPPPPRYSPGKRSTSYRPTKKQRMHWATRRDGLTDVEFVQRYKVTKRRFASLSAALDPYLSPKRHDSDGTNALSTDLKLSMTLRFLAGGAPVDILDIHGVRSLSTFYTHLWATCEALDIVLEFPDLVHDETLWETVARAFGNKRTDGYLAGMIGALDGIHIRIFKPLVRGTNAYFNRKGFFSVNCQAVADHESRFLWMSIRCPGSSHDSLAWRVSDLSVELAHAIGKRGYWLAADDAYAQSAPILTPYPGRNIGDIKDVFNFYHSSARMRVEMAFGQLVARFGIFWRPLRFKTLDKVTLVVSVAMKLHNCCVEDRIAGSAAVGEHEGDESMVDGFGGVRASLADGETEDFMVRHEAEFFRGHNINTALVPPGRCVLLTSDNVVGDYYADDDVDTEAVVDDQASPDHREYFRKLRDVIASRVHANCPPRPASNLANSRA